MTVERTLKDEIEDSKRCLDHEDDDSKDDDSTYKRVPEKGFELNNWVLRNERSDYFYL